MTFIVQGSEQDICRALLHKLQYKTSYIASRLSILRDLKNLRFIQLTKATFVDACKLLIQYDGNYPPGMLSSEAYLTSNQQLDYLEYTSDKCSYNAEPAPINERDDDPSTENINQKYAKNISFCYYDDLGQLCNFSFYYNRGTPTDWHILQIKNCNLSSKSMHLISGSAWFDKFENPCLPESILPNMLEFSGSAQLNTILTQAFKTGLLVPNATDDSLDYSVVEKFCKRLDPLFADDQSASNALELFFKEYLEKYQKNNKPILQLDLLNLNLNLDNLLELAASIKENCASSVDAKLIKVIRFFLEKNNEYTNAIHPVFAKSNFFSRRPKLIFLALASLVAGVVSWLLISGAIVPLGLVASLSFAVLGVVALSVSLLLALAIATKEINHYEHKQKVLKYVRNNFGATLSVEAIRARFMQTSKLSFFQAFKAECQSDLLELLHNLSI